MAKSDFTKKFTKEELENIEKKIRKDFAINLRNALMHSDYKQTDLAKLLGVTDAAVNSWLSAEKLPRMVKIDNMCILLGIKRSALLSEPGSQEQQKGYYNNPEVIKLVQELHDNPNGNMLKGLLDSTKNMKPESLKEVMKFIEYQKAKENNEDTDN